MSAITFRLTIRQILNDSHDSLLPNEFGAALARCIGIVCMSDKCCKEPMGAIQHSDARRMDMLDSHTP